MEDIDVTQNIKLVEKLKSELLSSVAELYSQMLSPNDTRNMTETFSEIIIFTYLLGNKLGIGSEAIDLKAASKLKLNIVEKNILYSESVNLLKHISRNGGNKDRV